MVDGSAPGQDRIAFMGHSTVLMRLAGEVLLTDPLLRPRVAHLRRYAPPAEAAEAVSAVLVSHAHQDHLDLPSLRAIGTGTPLIVPRGAGRWLSRRGFTAVTELAVGESASVGAVQVTAVPAHHDGRRYPLGPRSESVGYIARGSRSVYFAGDTGLFAEMSQLGAELDAALLPVAGWGRTLGPGHMDARAAARAAGLLAPRLAIPIHWGTFRPIGPVRSGLTLGREPASAFARHARELAPGTEVRILDPGEETPL